MTTARRRFERGWRDFVGWRERQRGRFARRLGHDGRLFSLGRRRQCFRSGRQRWLEHGRRSERQRRARGRTAERAARAPRTAGLRDAAARAARTPGASPAKRARSASCPPPKASRPEFATTRAALLRTARADRRRVQRKRFVSTTRDRTGASVTASVSGADAARFEIVAPSSFPVVIAPRSDVDVTLRLVTANTALGAAPAQDDGSTVLRATLDVTGGVESPVGAPLRARAHVRRARTDVRTNPRRVSLLHLEPPEFAPQRREPESALAPRRRSRDGRSERATLSPRERDGARHVPSARALLPARARAVRLVFARQHCGPNHRRNARPGDGSAHQRQEPHAASAAREWWNRVFSRATEPFGLWMAPAGVGLLASEDAEGFDGAHRVKVWTLRDASGAVRPNEYLVGGEEAANGDYQDYVFVVTNVVPVAMRRASPACARPSGRGFQHSCALRLRPARLEFYR